MQAVKVLTASNLTLHAWPYYVNTICGCDICHMNVQVQIQIQSPLPQAFTHKSKPPFERSMRQSKNSELDCDKVLLQSGLERGFCTRKMIHRLCSNLAWDEAYVPERWYTVFAPIRHGKKLSYQKDDTPSLLQSGMERRFCTRKMIHRLCSNPAWEEAFVPPER